MRLKITADTAFTSSLSVLYQHWQDLHSPTAQLHSLNTTPTIRLTLGQQPAIQPHRSLKNNGPDGMAETTDF